MPRKSATKSLWPGGSAANSSSGAPVRGPSDVNTVSRLTYPLSAYLKQERVNKETLPSERLNRETSIGTLEDLHVGDDGNIRVSIPDQSFAVLSNERTSDKGGAGDRSMMSFITAGLRQLFPGTKSNAGSEDGDPASDADIESEKILLLPVAPGQAEAWETHKLNKNYWEKRNGQDMTGEWFEYWELKKVDEDTYWTTANLSPNDSSYRYGEQFINAQYHKRLRFANEDFIKKWTAKK